MKTQSLLSMGYKMALGLLITILFMLSACGQDVASDSSAPTTKQVDSLQQIVNQYDSIYGLHQNSLNLYSELLEQELKVKISRIERAYSKDPEPLLGIWNKTKEIHALADEIHWLIDRNQYPEEEYDVEEWKNDPDRHQGLEFIFNRFQTNIWSMQELLDESSKKRLNYSWEEPVYDLKAEGKYREAVLHHMESNATEIENNILLILMSSVATDF